MVTTGPEQGVNRLDFSSFIGAKFLNLRGRSGLQINCAERNVCVGAKAAVRILAPDKLVEPQRWGILNAQNLRFF
jgi:hypothetical protein